MLVNGHEVLYCEPGGTGRFKHVAIGVIEYNGRYLLLRRRLDSTKLGGHAAGKMCFPGGTVETSDFDDESACLREIFEETGIRASQLSLKKSSTFVMQMFGDFYCFSNFHYFADDGPAVILEHDNFDDYDWCTVDEINASVSLPSTQATMYSLQLS